MIKANIIRDHNGLIWEFTIKGHSGFAAKGKDIVCAAVSAVAYTAAGALAELAGVSDYTEKDGFMKCSIPPGISAENRTKADIILETLAIGLKQIEEAYKEYVVVVEEEV
jgi:uncharacterized protein YsxB (DUF464 family)